MADTVDAATTKPGSVVNHHEMEQMNGNGRATPTTRSRRSSRDNGRRNSRPERSLSPNRGANINGHSNSRSRSRTRRDTESAMNDAVPLLPVEKHLPRPAPPLAGPELDDDDTNDTAATPGLHPGVDDGFFISTDNHQDPPTKMHPDHDHSDRDNGVHGRADFPSFPTSPGIELDIGDPRIIPDVNVYQHKKTLAQGMMDLALLSANANQLRYVLAQENHPYFYFNLIFISASLIIQVLVGVGLIMNSRYNVKKEDDICKADRINNLTVLGIFLITVVNVFISAFGVADAPVRKS